MLKWLMILTGNSEWQTRHDDRRERNKHFQWAFVFSLAVVGPVSCVTAVDLSGNIPLGLAAAVAAIFVPRAAAGAVDQALRARGLTSLHAGRAARYFLGFLWMGILLACGVWLHARGILKFAPPPPPQP